MSRPYGFMQAKYGRDVVQSNLQWASDNLDDQTIEVLNKGLNSNNLKDVEKAFSIVSHMREQNIFSLKKGKG